MASKADYINKVISDSIAEMVKPKPAPQPTNESTMFAMKRVVNGYMVSVIPEGANAQPTILVFTDWDSMVETIRTMMHPTPPIGEGH